MLTTRPVLLGLLLVAPSCAPLGEARDGGGVSREGGAVVLTGPALTDGSGSLLATMAGKVPNFRVQYPRGDCPIVTLRGSASFVGLSNPDVYVDGIRATDTCILESLRAIDVGRVEVYPQGFTNRPGYGTHAYGLILVFMRSALTD